MYGHGLFDSSSSSDDDDLLDDVEDIIVAAVCLAYSAPRHGGSVRRRVPRRQVLKTPKMADEEHVQTSSKRVADKQINKENPEPDDDSPEQEARTFKKASEEVMATRKIVKASIPVSKPPPSDVKMSNAQGSYSSEKANEGSNGSGKDADTNADSNEVAEIQKDEPWLKESDAKNKSSSPWEAHSPLTETDNKADNTKDGTGEDKVLVGGPKADNSKTYRIKGKTEDGDAEEKKVNEDVDEDKICKDGVEKKYGGFSFKNLSSGQNAFIGLVGTGFSGSSSSFGSASKESSDAPLFGLKIDGSSFPSFNIGGTNNAGGSAPALTTAAEASSKKFAMPEVPVETGEENEKAVFTADSALYEYLDGGWKERGKGALKLNIPVSGSERPRLIMRAKGNYRLILNAGLYDGMALKDMDKKGVTFACINGIREPPPSGLTTFALKFKDAGIKEDFKDAVEEAMKASDSLQTPGNSPKASRD